MNYSTKLIIVALLAFTVGGTCPSDVDGDNNVGVTDFLRVLRDWGPCESQPVVIAIDQRTGWITRLWSDGLMEEREVTILSCTEAVWTDWVPLPDGTPQGDRIVDFEAVEQDWVVRVWENGTVEHIRRTPGSDDWCGWVTAP
jgi:hypothetical protein